MDVGVRELKARLSEYLARAERGETITVTDRGQPKAILAPIPGRDRLDQGVAEGWVKAGRRSGLPAVKRYPALRPSDDVIAEDRGT